MSRKPRGTCSPDLFLAITTLLIPQQPLLFLKIILVTLLLLPLPPLIRRRSRNLGDDSLGRHILLVIPIPDHASVLVCVVLVLFRL